MQWSHTEWFTLHISDDSFPGRWRLIPADLLTGKEVTQMSSVIDMFSAAVLVVGGLAAFLAIVIGAMFL